MSILWFFQSFSHLKNLCFLWYYCSGESAKTPDKSTEKKNKKQKKKNSSEEAKVENSSSNVKKQTQEDSKSSQVRTYPNGLIVEELHMGKPNAKKAEPGKKVCALDI